MSILHTIYVSGTNCEFCNIDLEDSKARNEHVLKTPTTTFPYLETKDGNIAETNAILFFLAQKYKKDLLGNNMFETAKINQWIEFATCELNQCQKELIYPIFGWKEYNKESSNKKNEDLKKFLKILENELTNKLFIVGNKMTLADIVLFRYLRFFMIFLFPEGMRNKILPNLTKWFENIMKTNEAIRAYGRTLLCKTPLRPFMGKINRTLPNVKENKNKEINVSKKEEKKEKNEKKKGPRTLPLSEFNLEEFKKCFLKSNNKEEIINEFWEIFNPEEYSLWWIENQISPEENKTLTKASEAKNLFLQKMENLEKNSFAVHGVYGKEGNLRIRGVWMWKGKDIPKEMKEIDCYDSMTIRNLDHNCKEDVKLVNDYWIKVNKSDKIQGRYAADCSYFS